MKVILVPIDFSENSTNALEYATEMALALKTELIIVHVYDPPLAVQSGLHTVLSKDSGVVKISKNKLETITNTIREEYPSIQCSYELLVGEPVSEILNLIKSKSVDFVVMGTQGANRVVNILFGSNTAAIIERSDCPVLCIPHNVPFKIPERILFATNFLYSDISESSKLVEIASAFNASIIFGHVVVGDDETEEERSVIDKFATEIKLSTGYENITGKVISDSTVNTGLDLLIDETGVDIISLSTRKRTIFERFYNPSITKKFSYYTKIPLLAFHSKKSDDDTVSEFS